jgi:SUKH-4 immunity protein
MSDEYMDRWPRFKMVTYAAPTSIPDGWDTELLEKGAPDGLGCTAFRELTLFERPYAGPLVRFGEGHLLHTYVCLEPRTKQVVCVNYWAFRTGVPQPRFAGPASVVNSSLDHFIASIRAVTERFPYDSEVTGKQHRSEEDEEAREDRRFAEWEQAVLELADTLDRIDPLASTLGGQYWGVFLGDVGMGSYASETWLDKTEP